MIRIGILLATTVVMPGCGHWDVGDRAPGHSDIRLPPVQIAQRKVEAARDPGEKWIALLPGPLVGMAMNRKGGDMRVGASLGAELTLRMGHLDETHSHPLELMWARDVRANRLVPALNVGVAYSTNPSPAGGELAVYAELQLSRGLYGLAGGWSRTTTTPDHGPQVTGFVGPAYLRVTSHLERGTSFTIGLLAKAELAWLWSR